MIKRCRNCFEQFEEEYRVCPYCGYVEGTVAEESVYLPLGTVLDGRYLVGRVLGCGGFGTTYLAWDMQQNEKCAVKEYMPGEFSTRANGAKQVSVYSGEWKEQFYAGRDKLLEEAGRLSRLGDLEGIVRILDSFAENGTAYVVMEYLDGETLKHYLERMGKIEPELAVAMLQRMLESLKRIHGKGILHQDIAPDNIMLTADGKLKLIDFGAAKCATTIHSRSMTVVIKRGYSPEEQYRSRRDRGTYTDVYAVGATLYRMITGLEPPDAMERRIEYEKSGKDLLVPPGELCRSISENMENTLLNALNMRIEDRTPDMGIFLEELTSVEPVNRRMGKIKKTDLLNWPKWVKIGVSTSAAILTVLCVLFFTGVIGYSSRLRRDMLIPEGMARVPSVVNDELEEGGKRLEGAALVYSIMGKEYSDEIPMDLVLFQDITGGAVVIENTTVALTISGGPELGEVKNVEGLEIQAAIDILKEAGFHTEIKREYSSVIAKGYVIRQSEKPQSELPLNSTIILIVSKGVDPNAKIEKKEIEVPQFVGKTYEEAQKTAQKAGLILSVKERRYSDAFSADTVMEQDIGAGTIVQTGDVIELTISLGKEQIKAANVQFLPETEAVEKLRNQRLIPQVTYEASETVSEGLVIRQNPEAGTELEPEATVELVVSSGRPGFILETVVGRSEARAKAVLTEKGLAVVTAYEYSETIPEGNVIRQNPIAGTEVTRGTSVTLIVSTGEETVRVTGVVGKQRNTAESELQSVGFRVSVVEVYDGAARGTVINQMPTAGTSLKKGGEVMLTVSRGPEERSPQPTQPKPTEKETQGVQPTERETQPVQPQPVESEAQPKPVQPSQSKPVQTVPVETQPTTVSLSSIEIVTNPNKLNYYVNETLDTTGLSLRASYSNGNTEMINSGFICSPTVLNTVGNQIITVHYNGESTSFSVTVENRLLGGICGKQGDNIKWELNNQGVLTLRGQGETADWDYFTEAPWAPYREQITSIVVENGITRIGTDAFFNCTRATSISIPDTVTTISDRAISYCSSLSGINLPQSITSIGERAFESCTTLERISLPEHLVTISDGMFCYCTGLTHVNLGDDLQVVGNGAFENCYSLTDVDFFYTDVTTIEDGAFYKCTGIKNMFLPSTITYVGLSAFAEWTSSQNIWLERKRVPSTWHNNWDYACNARIYYGAAAESVIVVG